MTNIFHSYVKKACRRLNVLKRIGKHLRKLGKVSIHYSFILSNFNYCPLVWHFCEETNTKKIEKILERVLRFIYNDYASDYDSRFLKSKLSTLKIRRLRTMIIESFKILNYQGPVYLNNLVNFKSNSYSCRYTNTAEIPQVRRTRYGSYSFRFEAAKLWNKLPQCFINISYLNHLKESDCSLEWS